MTDEPREDEYGHHAPDYDPRGPDADKPPPEPPPDPEPEQPPE